MQETYIENIKKVLSNKPKLEKELEVEITNKGKNVFVDGSAEKEFIALEVLGAINMGFPLNDALELRKEDVNLQILNIKDLTKRTDLERVRARIIGKHGGTLRTLNNLTQCNIQLYDNNVGVIGDCEEIDDAIQALTSLIQGSKQSNVYARLEKQRKKKKEEKDVIIRNELK